MKTWDVPVGFASLTEALAAQPYDVAIIACPTKYHLATLKQLLASEVRGVICEKPLGGDPLGARELVYAYEKYGKPLAVAFPRRWDPAMAELREEITANRWGKLHSVTGCYGRGVVNNGSHLVDLIGFLTNFTPQIVCVGMPRHDGITDDPSIDALLKLENGASMHLVTMDGRDYAFFELTLVFERGVVTIEESGFAIRRRPVEPSAHAAGIHTVGIGIRTHGRYGQSLVAMLDDMSKSLREGTRLKSDGRSAIAALTLTDTLRKRALAQEINT
jgi:predicted dehydrogenase